MTPPALRPSQPTSAIMPGLALVEQCVAGSYSSVPGSSASASAGLPATGAGAPPRRNAPAGEAAGEQAGGDEGTEPEKALDRGGHRAR